MSPEQKAAYVNSQVACAQIEAMAMWTANQAAESAGKSIPHSAQDFLDLMEKYGIHHNAIHHYTHT